MEEKKEIVAIMSMVLNIKYDLPQIFELHVFACHTANFCASNFGSDFSNKSSFGVD